MLLVMRNRSLDRTNLKPVNRYWVMQHLLWMRGFKCQKVDVWLFLFVLLVLPETTFYSGVWLVGGFVLCLLVVFFFFSSPDYFLGNGNGKMFIMKFSVHIWHWCVSKSLVGCLFFFRQLKRVFVYFVEWQTHERLLSGNGDPQSNRTIGQGPVWQSCLCCFSFLQIHWE